jgi:copper(I)-binding protein
MKLLKEIAFASALTLASFISMPDAFAHEIKIGDITISHPWSRQSPMGLTCQRAS